MKYLSPSQFTGSNGITGLVLSALLIVAIPAGAAQTPQFECPGTQPVGSLDGNVVTLSGLTGNIELAGPGGCIEPSQGGGTPGINLGTIPVTVNGGTVNFGAAPVLSMNLAAPANVSLHYRLQPAGGGTIVQSAVLPFSYPSLVGRSIGGLSPGTYTASILATMAGEPLALSVPAFAPVVIESSAPTTPCLSCPDNWTFTTQTWQQAWGADKRFPDVGGNQLLSLNTTHNAGSPSQTTNQIRSYRFVIGNDDPGYGKINLLQAEGHGGVQWFWISKAEDFQPAPSSAGPGDLMLLGYNLTGNGTWDSNCGKPGTTPLSYATTELATVPSSPSIQFRCRLERNKPYYLNVGFYRVRDLVETHTHTNTCTRPATNPSSWNCHAYFVGQQLQTEDPVGE